MDAYIKIAISVISIVLIGLVMLQTKGGGLGSMFGSDGSVYQTRRGVEKSVYNMTIVFAIIFMALSLATVL